MKSPNILDSLCSVGIECSSTHLQILMNVRQLKEQSVSTDVQIHWDHFNVTAMKGICWNRISANVSIKFFSCK